MHLADLKPQEGARRRRKRVGRGRASGHGKTSTRGHNGQGQRSGESKRFGFEGGQTPLFVVYLNCTTSTRSSPVIGLKSTSAH